MGTAALAITVLQALPALLAAGADVLALIERTNAVIADAQARGGDPTDAEWADINGQVAALKATIDAAG